MAAAGCGRQASCQLAVHRTGKKAHVDGPDISADFTGRQLASFLTDVVTKWADTHPVFPGRKGFRARKVY